MGRDAGLDLDLLGAVRVVNDRQRRLLSERVVARFGEDLRGHTFALWGLAFKPDTDDLREAPSLVIIDDLLRRGARVRAFDPVAMPRAEALFRDAAGFVERLGADLTVHLGDITLDGQTRSEELAFASTLVQRWPTPVRCVPGN